MSQQQTTQWPDPARPGVPPNPERDGWHWVRTPDDQNAPYQWRAAGECERGKWGARWIFEAVQEWDPRLGTYLGPCLTPEEVAAREQAARDQGRIEGAPLGVAELDAMLAAVRREGMEAAARLIDCGCNNAAEVVKVPPNSAARWELCGQANCCAIVAAAIRAAAKETPHD